MADDSVKYVKTARVLAILHIIVGFLLFCFGVALGIVVNVWTGFIYFTISVGVWMIIAGGLGIPGTRKERSTSRTTFAGIFIGFAIVSAVLGGIILIIYGIYTAILYDHNYNNRKRYREKYEKEMAITTIILILGIVEVTIGIAVCVCLCLKKPSNCCYSTPFQQQQAMYTANAGYVMTQGPGGVPVAIPMQAAGGMGAVQTVTPNAQEDHPAITRGPVKT